LDRKMMGLESEWVAPRGAERLRSNTCHLLSSWTLSGLCPP